MPPPAAAMLPQLRGPAAAVARGWPAGRRSCVAPALGAAAPSPPPLPRAPLAPSAAVAGAVSFSTRFSLDEETLRVARREGPVGAYQRLAAAGVLQESEEQQRIIHVLSAIFHGLQGGGSKPAQVKGLYIHGSVGSGKSMVMDLFFACVSHHLGRCRRMHFHEFMHLVHRMVHRAKAEAPGERPVEAVARSIGSEVGTLLCFDEMAITTIQDCCLLAPLFEAMWEAGIVTVMTSNRAPEDLYAGGLNRHLYLPPFIASLKAHCAVVPLVLNKDYRQEQVARSGLAREPVFCELGGAGFAEAWWLKATGGATKRRESFEGGYGRRLEVTAHSGVAMVSFQELCGQNRSVEDYHALCERYHTIILQGIPALDAECHNEARRFTNLIDASYEAHARLVACFDAPLPEVLSGLTALQNVGLEEVGHAAGCGDGDTSGQSSGVLEAVARMKAAVERAPPRQEVLGAVFPGRPTVSADDALAGGEPDMDIWRQDSNGSPAPPQVSKRWDDRRRVTQFSWEAGDPTAEQQTIKGVFAAAVASLKETGFASARTHSRLMEMQSNAYLDEWALKRGLALRGGAGGGLEAAA